MAFAVETRIDENTALMTLSGELDGASAQGFRDRIEELVGGQQIDRLVLILDDLSYMASAGLRALVFAKQKLGATVELYLVGTQSSIVETIELTGFQHSVVMLDSLDAVEQFNG